MNESQLAARRKQLADDAAEVDAQIADAVTRKSYSGMADLEARVERLAEERAELDRAEANHKAAERLWNRTGGSTADALDGPTLTKKAFQTGRDVSPLQFTEDALRTLHKAVETRQSVSVKAFSSVESLIPAQLSPVVVGKEHENRLLDYLPATAISAPSYEFIVHNSTTNSPGIVAEGATKPDVVLNTTSSIATVSKVAATFGLSYESLRDWPNFTSYAHQEMTKQIIDVENQQLLSGAGTGGQITGFLNTTGILTHTISTETGLDAVEMSIAALRSGSALAEADLLVLHPATWSALRRTKSTYGTYLVNPDPTEGQGDQLWGVKVLVTTAQAAGTGLLLDTHKFGTVLVREGITVQTGYSNDDFSRNICRWAIETRLALAVERPASVLAISGLPTS